MTDAYLLQLALWATGVAVMVLLTWESEHLLHVELGMIMLIEWGLTNLALAALGRAGEPLFTPTIDAVCAVAVALVGWKHKSLLAAVVFLLFALLGGFYVAAIIGRIETTNTYYFAKNAIFATQCLAIGGVCGLEIVGRAVSRRQRLRVSIARW